MIASIIDTTTLGKVVLYSLVSGVGITVVFGVGVTSAAGLLEALRQRRTGSSIGWALLAFVCVACALAAVVLGIVVMTSKS